MSATRTGIEEQRVDVARVVEVVYVEFLRGRGVEGDPIRTVCQWRTRAGELIVERDNSAGVAFLGGDGWTLRGAP